MLRNLNISGIQKQTDCKIQHTNTPIQRLDKISAPLKRAPLPPTIFWNGQCGKDFEEFIDKFTGHVAQQPHMGYILFDAIGAIWSQFKDAETVLRMATAQRVHISLFHITPHQLLNDMSWLFGAMQQSITGRGNHIIRKYESSQDGIMCWKCFVKKYRYNGNVDVYLAKLNISFISSRTILKSRVHQFNKFKPATRISNVEASSSSFKDVIIQE